MKTTYYNPSEIETEFAKAVIDLRDEIQNRITSQKIVSIENDLETDNPKLMIKLEDGDGDKNELIITFIQRLEE